MIQHNETAERLISLAVRERNARLCRTPHECGLFSYIHVLIGNKYVSIPVHTKEIKKWEHAPLSPGRTAMPVTLGEFEEMLGEQNVSPPVVEYRNRYSKYKSLNKTC